MLNRFIGILALVLVAGCDDFRNSEPEDSLIINRCGATLFVISERRSDGWSMMVPPDGSRETAALGDRTFALLDRHAEGALPQQFASGRLTLDVYGVVVFEGELCQALLSDQDCAAAWDEHDDGWDVECTPFAPGF